MVGKGWRPIVDEAVKEIESYGGKIFQIKEKFGGLRIYVNHRVPDTEDKIDEIIQKAEGKAAVTCEACGKPGKPVSIRGWYKTACPDHENGWGMEVYKD